MRFPFFLLNIGAALWLGLIAHGVSAGFLEMPVIEQVPAAENDILLKDLDIPSVRKRDPDPHYGPRLNVTAFRVQGIVEYPELGITRKALIKLVEDLRYDMMKEGELMYSGYTLEELSELQDEIIDIEKETRGGEVSRYDLQRLVFLIRKQRRKRGVTLGMLETVADEITKYYRERGFILARAFIPEQQVRDGVVTLTLLLGYLGEAKINNNVRYNQAVVDGIFNDVLHKPVTTALMEEKLYYLNDMPGLSAQGFFAPGRQVGDTLLNINVTREKPFNANVRIDNHGSDQTGEYRLYTDVALNNPFKYGDRFQLAVLAATEPEQSLYGSFRYSGPLFHYRWGFDVGASQNAFVLGLEQGGAQTLDLGGRSTTFDLGVKYQLTRSRVHSSAIALRASEIHAVLEYDDQVTKTEVSKDLTRNVELSYNFDVLNERSRGVHVGRAHITRSQIVESAYSFMLEDTWFAGFDYTHLRFLPAPFSWEDFRLMLRTSGHYVGKQLPSVNQFAVAGPTRSRAYKTNTFFGDDALYVGADLIFPAPKWRRLGEYVQLYLFADAAYGRSYITNHDGSHAERNEASLSGVGLGLKFYWQEALRGNLSLAHPVDYKIAENLDLAPNEENKVYFDVQYSF